MAIAVKLGVAEAVFAVGAIESKIDASIKFVKETDERFGYMNNIHKGAMRDLLGARDTLVEALRAEGYAMERIKEFDTSLPEWQDISHSICL